METSTFSADDTSTSNKLFSKQNFFLDISINTYPFVTKCVEVIPEFRFGRENLAGEEISNPGVTKFFQDAEIIEGGVSLLVHREEDPLWYLKLTPSFLYTVDDRLTKDFRFDFFYGGGYMNPTKTSPLYGSSFEVGQGYSERFNERFRHLKAKLELTNLNYQVQPFITVRMDSGTGPDDLKVFFGVRIPLDRLLAAITAEKQ